MATATPKKTSTAVAVAIEGTIMTLTFAHGKQLKLYADDLRTEIQSAAMMHGLKQKLVDGAAIGRDPETGRTATIDDKYNAVLEIFNRLTGADGKEPTWNKIREASEAGSGKGGLLVDAMMRVTGKARAEIQAFLDSKSKEEVAALRKNARIAEAIAKIQVERAKTDGIDSDALLDGLMEEGGEGEEA